MCVPPGEPVGDRKRALNRHRHESTAIASDLPAWAHSNSDVAERTGTKIRGRPVEPRHRPEAAVAFLLETEQLLGTVLKRDGLVPATYPFGASGVVQLFDWTDDSVCESDLDNTGERVFQ